MWKSVYDEIRVNYLSGFDVLQLLRPFVVVVTIIVACRQTQTTTSTSYLTTMHAYFTNPPKMSIFFVRLVVGESVEDAAI